ncbi:hypothetical protein PAXINDRAFT_21713 [Paxillus involutus ATCC 200175]|uniref:Uncharacterized protein n=1 Tax=Paxillus involutus ATCC 200175 TaxID=664439 RepID=A0A0C9T0K6_PAXIN|nr:hypothetical protein PAXINDRAFT_21713 [Paxillus involutus ATCC 200175]
MRVLSHWSVVSPCCRTNWWLDSWGRGWGAYPSNFPSLRPQGSAFAAPSTVREQPALPQEVPPTTSKGEGASEARSSTSDSMTKGPSSRSKPTKATQWYTAEWSEDEPVSDDTNNNWSTLTQMRSVGNSVVLTINKWEFVFSGEAAKNAQSTYQKGHLPPISQGMKHFRDSATPLTTDAIDRLFAHAREGRGKARGMPLSDHVDGALHETWSGLWSTKSPVNGKGKHNGSHWPLIRDQGTKNSAAHL